MIPASLLRDLRYLEIATSKAILEGRIGPLTSRARGQGFDFDQHTAYRPGDDVRRIDWNATARLGTPYVRQTHAERELDVVMALDLSRSMEIGAGGYSKKELMTLAAASLLFSAAADQFNAGFLTFSDRILGWTPPRRVSGRAWRLLEDIWAIDAKPGETSLLPPVRHLASTLRTTSVIAIVSDFITREEVFGSAELRLLAAQHDVIAIAIEDPADTALPGGRGFIRVRDVETGAAMTVALNDRTRRAYAAAADARRQAITGTCHRLGIDLAFVRTDQRPMATLIDLFARRKSA